jgi:hypothetical protein
MEGGGSDGAPPASVFSQPYSQVQPPQLLPQQLQPPQLLPPQQPPQLLPPPPPPAPLAARRELREDEKAAYRAEEFEVGKVPEEPPDMQEFV